MAIIVKACRGDRNENQYHFSCGFSSVLHYYYAINPMCNMESISSVWRTDDDTDTERQARTQLQMELCAAKAKQSSKRSKHNIQSKWMFFENFSFIFPPRLSHPFIHVKKAFYAKKFYALTKILYVYECESYQIIYFVKTSTPYVFPYLITWVWFCSKTLFLEGETDGWLNYEHLNEIFQPDGGVMVCYTMK